MVAQFLLHWDTQEAIMVVVTFVLSLADVRFSTQTVEVASAFMLAKIVWGINRTSLKHFQAHWRSSLMYLFHFLLVLKVLGLNLLYSPRIILFSCLFSCAVTAVLLWLFPVPKISPLPGNFRVGSFSFLLTNEGSSDIPVQCWFPLNSNVSGKRSLIWTSGSVNDALEELILLLDRLADYSKIPKLLSRHLILGETNAFCQEDFRNLAKLKQYKIAIYSHGMYGWRQVHSSCCEKLASCGFLVFSCDHSPDSMISRPPGKINESIPFDFQLPKNYDIVQERKFYGKGLTRRVNDIRTLVDFLLGESVGSKFPQLSKKIDRQNINCWGHSYGGATMTAYCCQYPFIARTVNLDAWLFPVPDEILKKGLLSPAALYLSAELWQFGKFQVPFRRSVVKNSKLTTTIYDLVIRGSGHQNYCETHYLASKQILTAMSVVPKIHDPKHLLDSIDHIILSFFCASTGQSGNNESNPIESLLRHLVYQLEHPETLRLNKVLENQLRHFVLKNTVHESIVFGDVE